MFALLGRALTFAAKAPRLWVLGVVMMLSSVGIVVPVVGTDEPPLFETAAALMSATGVAPGVAVAAVAAICVLVAVAFLAGEWATAVVVAASDAASRDGAPAPTASIAAVRRVWRRVVAVDALLILPVLGPVAALFAVPAVAADSRIADVALPALRFATSGLYAGLAVVLALFVWAWRDMAVRHAVLGGEGPLEAVRSAAADLTAHPVRIALMALVMWLLSSLASIVVVPVLAAIDALGGTGSLVVTPELAWRYAVPLAAVPLAPYALFDAAVWTYVYRALRLREQAAWEEHRRG